MKPAGEAPRRAWIFWGLALALLFFSSLERFREYHAVAGPKGYWFWDNDTVRRLSRLDLLDRTGNYPAVDPWDGYPDGSVLHWTLPMDWVIRALEGPASLVLPKGRKWEAGAALAGPFLSALALVLLLLGVRRLRGDGTALAAGLFYAFSYSCLNVSWFGNGDHQNLQHLLLLASLLLGLLAVEKKAPPWAAILSGAFMGGAVWVSTESMLLLYAAAGLLFLGEIRKGEEGEEGSTILLPWSLGLVPVLLLGHLMEHPGNPGAFLWDQISLFQVLQGGTLLLFALLQAAGFPEKRRPWSSAGLSLLAGGIVLFTFFEKALVDEMVRFHLVHPWLQEEVSEYRTLFTDGTGFTFLPAIRRFSFLLPAFPLLAWAAWKNPGLSPRGRKGLVLLGIGTLALACWEVKLAHLFSLVFPLLVALAAWEGLPRLTTEPALKKALGGAAFLLVGAAALTSLPEPPHERPRVAQMEQLTSELCRDLKALDGGGRRGSVLAPWDLGAKLMYYARVPVVSSGYHRNIRGILEGFEVYIARPGKEEEGARRILLERKAAFLVVLYDRLFLADAPKILGRKVILAERTPSGLVFTPEAEKTLYWRLRSGRAVAGFRKVKDSDALVVVDPGTPPVPYYRIYRFLPE